MTDRFTRGWSLMKQSWSVLQVDKKLIVFPILSFLACLVVLASFTGYLVPWDPAEARFVGEATLNRFFILHIVALPVALVLLSVGWWRAFRSPSAAHHLGEFRVEATAEVGAGSIGAHHARDAVNRTNGSSRGS